MEMTSAFLFPEKLRNQKIELGMELVKGKEYAKQLEAIFDNIVLGDEGVALKEELAQKILRSFTDSLAKISLCRTKDLGQMKNFQKSDFVESSKKRPAEMMKEKRMCYKRRKEVVSWLNVSPTTEDGYAWRKYGQKAIQNSKHPRCYFRCTNKFDQDCKALKQVQKLEGEGGNMYQTTYFSQHTCKDQTMAPITSDYEASESTSIIDFRVKMPTSKPFQHIPPRNDTFVASIPKQESNGDTQSDLTDNVSSIESNVIMWPDNVGSEDCSPKIGSFHDQEVASSLFDGDASIYLAGLDIKNLINDAFPDFSYEDL
ncbi:DNA-binding transcription factor [Lithospermum erythrorhizon]|uniref:DNA-binding transcription factor n=1 Tax=Lithospermum erythrorhizon TaxID=34254 RepID=A0AAV3PE15_LITER